MRYYQTLCNVTGSLRFWTRITDQLLSIEDNKASWIHTEWCLDRICTEHMTIFREFIFLEFSLLRTPPKSTGLDIPSRVGTQLMYLFRLVALRCLLTLRYLFQRMENLLSRRLTEWEFALDLFSKQRIHSLLFVSLEILFLEPFSGRRFWNDLTPFFCSAILFP